MRAPRLLWACVPLAVVLTGCGGTFRPGDPGRGAATHGSYSEIRWPQRDVPEVRITQISAGPRAAPDAQAPQIVREVRAGAGIVRVMRGDPADPAGLWREPDSGLSYRFVSYCDRVELRTSEEARLLSTLNRRPVGPGDRSEDPLACMLDGSRIGLLLPTTKPRAVMLYLPGMAGARPAALMDWARQAGLAFIEVKTCAMDTPRAPVRVATTADVEPTARAIAQDADQRLAQAAFDAEGAIEFFCTEHPELRGLPVVVVGASAGAIATPAVIMRLGDRAAMAVLIGGGCDIFLISQRTNLSKTLLPVEWGPRTSYLDQGRVDAIYRQTTTLDPLVLAPRLSQVPVLNIFATSDSFVPTFAAKELQECLGNPDSVTYSGGHMAMFLSLRDDSSIVMRWIESHLNRDSVRASP